MTLGKSGLTRLRENIGELLKRHNTLFCYCDTTLYNFKIKQNEASTASKASLHGCFVMETPLDFPRGIVRAQGSRCCCPVDRGYITLTFALVGGEEEGVSQGRRRGVHGDDIDDYMLSEGSYHLGSTASMTLLLVSLHETTTSSDSNP